MELLRRLEHHARNNPDAIAYRFVAGNSADVSVTWRELATAIFCRAEQFASKLKAGETLLVSSPNCIEVVVAILAGFAAGLRVFPVSPELSETELLRLTDESCAIAAVGSNRVIKILQRKLKTIWPIESPPVSAANHFLNRPAGDLILQSSGTTGFPRLVLRRSNSLDAVSSGMVESIGFRSDDQVLAVLPLSHSYGLEHGLLAPIWAGSGVVLGQGLDIRLLTRELSAGATIVPTVPSVIELLCDLPGSPCVMPKLRRIYSAGGPLPKAVFDRFFHRYRIRISQLYGATEVGSVTFNSADDSDFDPESVGKPMNGVQIKIVEGQVMIRAASMFDGYLDAQPELLNGFFPTGDLGMLDEHSRLTITGRLKLLIDVGGMKVNPLEVESVLREHPDVGQCVVVPIRQSETVFRVKAIATPRDPTRPPPVEELRQLARQRLATYKVPRIFEIRQSLPVTTTGKVLRHLVETSS